jgi:hypothetical protein
MATIITINDPTIYPVVFVLPNLSPVSATDETAVVPFVCVETGAELRAAVCRFSGKYLFDVDPYGSNIPLVRQGRKVVYEVAPNSKDIASAELTILVWTSATSFFVLGAGDHGDLRQTLSSEDTVHSVYLSASSVAFNAVTVGGVPYFPSLSVEYLTDPFVNGATAAASGTVSSVGGQDFTIMDGGDQGVVWVHLAVSTDWYLDAGRTVPAPIPPAETPYLSGTIIVRAIFADGGKYYKSGQVALGTAQFAGLLKGSSAPTTRISYLVTDVFGTVFTESMAVNLKDSGLPDQPGNTGATYLLGVPITPTPTLTPTPTPTPTIP